MSPRTRVRWLAVPNPGVLLAAALCWSGFSIGLEAVPTQLSQPISFPGAPADSPVKAHGGYIEVDATAGRNLYYVLISAENDHNGSAPVVLWLNGGPGCSSVGGGFFSELGPFYPDKYGQKLKLNDNRWNLDAHVLFVDSPAHTGFSYSTAQQDWHSGDAKTTKDLLEFLKGFYGVFPKLRARDLLLSGESYAGHYVPLLADSILQFNKQAGHPIKLVGVFVGNPWTEAAIDNPAAVNYWGSHGLVGMDVVDGLVKTCDFVNTDPLSYVTPKPPAKLTCAWYMDRAFDAMVGINMYNIYADVCATQPTDIASGLGPSRMALELPFRRRRLGLLRSKGSGGWRTSDPPSGTGGAPAGGEAQTGEHRGEAKLKERLGDGRRLFGGVSLRKDACIDNHVFTYINRADVMEAMHVNTKVVPPGRWKLCSDRLHYNKQDQLASMRPVYLRLLAAGLPVAVYSGDVDAMVPFTGTQAWVKELGLQELEPWRPWASGAQVGGYVWRLKGLTLITIRGGGHMAPYSQPLRMLQVFTTFNLHLRGEANPWEQYYIS